VKVFRRIPNEIHASDVGSSLHVLELQNVPFLVKRLYWISGITPNEPRGFHAHKNLNQVMIVIEGQVSLKLCRGSDQYLLEVMKGDPHVFIPPGTWREIYAKSKHATILVIADSEYIEDDYLRDWPEYLRWFSGNLNVS
jgi:dTDP-4-dehydrorhamnose 3,5-epimerase-like enzyme